MVQWSVKQDRNEPRQRMRVIVNIYVAAHANVFIGPSGDAAAGAQLTLTNYTYRWDIEQIISENGQMYVLRYSVPSVAFYSDTMAL